MSGQQVIMNYTIPPSYDDLEVIAQQVLDTLPDELLECLEDDIVITVEDMADETLQADMDLDDPFELLLQYKSGKELAPGIEKKEGKDDDTLILYRRAILDMWCEVSEDLEVLIRQLMIEEFGRCFDFSDEEVDEMTQRHYQGML